MSAAEQHHYRKTLEGWQYFLTIRRRQNGAFDSNTSRAVTLHILAPFKLCTGSSGIAELSQLRLGALYAVLDRQGLA